MAPRTRLSGLAVVAALAAGSAAPSASASTAADDRVAGPTGSVRCFDPFREAIAHASRGRLADAPKSARQVARSPHVRRGLRRRGR